MKIGLMKTAMATVIAVAAEAGGSQFTATENTDAMNCVPHVAAREDARPPVAASWRMFERRLGVFVHWGIYSVNGWHEQERWRLGVPRAEYAALKDRFRAERFDADALAKAAADAGAEYLVFTAKHHDGFCMWATATTDFCVTNSPCGRDLLGEVADACRRRGLRLGLYYSNPDWNHPNAWNPRSTHQFERPEPGDEPDMAKYREYVKAQVTELLTNYGEIVCFFWDIPPKIDAPEMNELVRRLQPGIMVNNRGWGGGDYSTPERGDGDQGAFAGRYVEACDSVGARSWGYRANEDYHTLGYLTRAIDATLSRGGNFLLNVGPKEDGTLPDEAARLLAGVGEWYGKVRESYRGVETATNVVNDSTCVVTRRGGTTYLHYPKGLDATGVDLAPLDALPKSATLLNTGESLRTEVAPMPANYFRPGGAAKPTLHLSGIPADALANEAVVIKIE